MTNNVSITKNSLSPQWNWSVPEATVSYDEAGIQEKLRSVDKACYFVENKGVVGVSHEAYPGEKNGNHNVVAFVAASSVDQLGDPAFREAHKTCYAYYAGAMANGFNQIQKPHRK